MKAYLFETVQKRVIELTDLLADLKMSQESQESKSEPLPTPDPNRKPVVSRLSFPAQCALDDAISDAVNHMGGMGSAAAAMVRDDVIMTFMAEHIASVSHTAGATVSST